MPDEVPFEERVALRHGSREASRSPSAFSSSSSSDRGSSTSSSSSGTTSSSLAERSTTSTSTFSTYLNSTQSRAVTLLPRSGKRLEEQKERDSRQQHHHHQQRQQRDHSSQVTTLIECPNCGYGINPDDQAVASWSPASRHTDIKPSRTPPRSTTPSSTSTSSSASAPLQRLTPTVRPTSKSTSRTTTPATSRTPSPSLIGSRPSLTTRHHDPSASCSTSTSASQPNETNLNFLVVGGTGVGKSLFVDLLHSQSRSPATRSRPKIGNTLSSCTSTVTSYPCLHSPTSTRYNLIDTPGLDDTLLSDAEHLTSLSTFLNDLYSRPSSQKIHGIIFLTRITDTRLSASHIKTAQIIRRICGDQWKGRYALMSSMWDLLHQSTQEWGDARRREREMCRHPQFWGNLSSDTDGEATPFQFHGTRQSAQSVVDWFLTPQNAVWLRNPPALLLHSQLSTGKLVSETTAGIYVLGELSEQRAKHLDAVARLRKEIEEAKMERNGKAVKVYEGMEMREVGRLREGEGALRKMMGFGTRELMAAA